jgi:asparagine synthase (glutamine-hydrolysing)
MRQSNTALRTFSIAFDDVTFDESVYQREIVRAFRTDHVELRCSASDISRVFPDVVWHAETPLLRTAPAPLFLLSRLTRDSGCNVVLTGEGRGFCSGADLRGGAEERAYRRVLTDEYNPLIVAIRELPKPVVAAVNGVAAGAGAGAGGERLIGGAIGR